MSVVENRLSENDIPEYISKFVHKAMWRYLNYSSHSRMGIDDFKLPMVEYKSQFFEREKNQKQAVSRAKLRHEGLIKLILDQRMKVFWENVPVSFAENKCRYQVWLFEVFYSAFPSPEHQAVTKTEAYSGKESWKVQFINSVKKARKLAKQCPDNMRGWDDSLGEELLKMLLAVGAKEQWEPPKCYNYLGMDRVFSLVEEHAKQATYEQGAYPVKVTGSHVDRIFFIKTLASALLFETQKKNNKLIENAVGVIFGEDIDSQFISKHTKGLFIESVVHPNTELAMYYYV